MPNYPGAELNGAHCMHWESQDSEPMIVPQIFKWAVEIHCATNLTILKQRSIKGHESMLMDDFTYTPTKSFSFLSNIQKKS